MNPGEILDNRYEIVQRLGAGGMGEVYLATHTHLGSSRVIKVVHPQISGNTDAHDRFLREARAATKVHHPNVATLHDFSTLGTGSHYMVWEYIDGENLAQKLRARGTLPPREGVRLIIQALHGLEAIHRAGIIHRDISPENLMITRDDETVKIIDLGVAKVEDSEVSQTRTGIFVGKLRYAAPEQLGFLPENEKIDARADIYSTAMVLVELLTGRPPYEAKSPHEYFILHASQAPMKTVELPAELPGSAALQAVVAKALARNRNERYATAREFALALEEIEKTLPDPREMATMAMPYDGDETMKLGGHKTADTLHRSTLITGSGSPPPPPTIATPLPAPLPAQPAAPPTVLTPFPQQQFPAQAPKQGSMVPLLVVIAAVLLLGGAGAYAVYRFWPFGKAKTAETQVAQTTTTTTTQPATTSAQTQATIAATSVDVTPGATTTTAPPPVIVETTQTAPPPVVTTTTATSKPPVVVETKPQPVRPKDTSPAEDEEAPPREESAPSGSFNEPTFVDGGDDDYRNERAMESLRRALRGTNTVALRAGGMTPELARALREQFPHLRFEANADVVIRFQGTFERRPRALKRRAATATVEKNGRVVFRYQLPEEVYRTGDTPAEAFVRVLANAMEED